MAKDVIKIDDLDKIELKLGKILECEKHPNADRLLVFQIDLGEERRQIISSIAEFYTCEELIGKSVVVVTNLKPAKFRGLESNGMLLCASTPNEEQLDLLTITRDLPAGSKVD
ncbi:MAG: methionine--tRNA ligase subunit beta [Bacillaceae bacterium]